MTSTIVPSKISSHQSDNPLETGLDVVASDAVSKLLLLISKTVWFGFLLGLFVVSLAVWIWIASFRSGWRFWTWAQDKENDAVSTSLAYGLIILIISPIVMFFEWSQRVLPDRLKIKTDIPIAQFIQEQLHIDLGDSFPFKPTAEETAATGPALSAAHNKAPNDSTQTTK